MRIGVDAYTLGPRAMSAGEVADFAANNGLEGVQFLDPRAIDADLDPIRLAAFRRKVCGFGLYLEIGISSPNPLRSREPQSHASTRADLARELANQLEAASLLGCSTVRAYVGDRHDRFRADVSWADQLAATAAVLRELRATLRGLRMHVAIETHGDITVDELLALVDDVGDDVLGVTLDTGNLLMRLEDPLLAVERLAPLVRQTHLKDAVLAFTQRGLCWQARPVGSGIVPIPDILAVLQGVKPDLNLSIELHPRTYDLPIFDRSWLGYFPALRAESLAAVVRLAAACEARYASGELPRPEEVEAVNWLDRDIPWLAQSVGYLRALVGVIGTL